MNFLRGFVLFGFVLFFLSIFMSRELCSKGSTYLFRKCALMVDGPSLSPGKKEVLFPNLLSTILKCISNFFLKAQPLIRPPALTVASEKCHTDCSEEMPSFYPLNSTGSCFLHHPLLNEFLKHVGKNNL